MRNEQEPTTEKVDSPVSETVERHPAYAQIGASRVNGQTHLYGSDFVHHNYVTIAIHASELRRGLSNDWPFALEEYIEVALSEAQWATFVSSMNVGTGVQCTLLALRGQHAPGIARPKPKGDQFKQEMAGTLGDAQEALQRLRGRLVAGKGGKESLALLDLALREIRSNAQFVADQFGEHMEHTVERAKIEVNAYAQHVVTRLGLKAAQAPLTLGEGQDTSGRED